MASGSVPLEADARGSSSSDDPRAWKDPGAHLDPRIDRAIPDEAAFHRVMDDPDDPNYFGALVFSLERYLLDPHRAHRPILFLPTVGGGADVAGAILMAAWHIDRLCAQPRLREAFKLRYKRELDYGEFLKARMLEVLILNSAEKKVDHVDRSLSDRGVSVGFYAGSKIENAGRPHRVVGGGRVTYDALALGGGSGSPQVRRGKRRGFKLISRATPNSRFRHRGARDLAGRRVVFDGQPLDPPQVAELARELLGVKDLHYLSLAGGTVAEAGREIALFLRRHVRVQGRTETRPLFGMIVDPGGDSFVKRETRRHRPNPLISEVNEGYGILALARLLRGEAISLGRDHGSLAPIRGKWLFAPFAWSIDGESNGESCNAAFDELDQAGALAGLVSHIPSWIPRGLLHRLFGLGGQGQVLASNANRRALLELFDAAARQELSGRSRLPRGATFRAALGRLKPLRTVGEIPRDDVPVGALELVEGDALSLVSFVTPREGLTYLERKFGLSHKEAEPYTWPRLRARFEVDHAVTGENAMPSRYEYDAAKLPLLRRLPRSLLSKLPPEQRQVLVPQQARGGFRYLDEITRRDNGGAPDLLALVELARRDPDAFDALQRRLSDEHARSFVDDTLARRDSNIGVVRMNARFLLAYLERDHPEIYRYLVAHRDVAEGVIVELKQAYGESLLAYVDELDRPARAGRRRSPALARLAVALPEAARAPNGDVPAAATPGASAGVLAQLGQVLERGENPRASRELALRRASMALHILRINPECGEVLYQGGAGGLPLARREHIARLQISAIQAAMGALFGSGARRRNSQAPPYRVATEPGQSTEQIEALRLQIDRWERHSGSFEKLRKMLAELVLLHTFLGEWEAARTTATVLYNTSPERLHEPVARPFDQRVEPRPALQLVQTLFNLRKPTHRVLELVRELARRRDASAANGEGDFVARLALAALASRAPESGDGLFAEAFGLPAGDRDAFVSMLEDVNGAQRAALTELDEISRAFRRSRERTRRLVRAGAPHRLSEGRSVDPLGTSPADVAGQIRAVLSVSRVPRGSQWSARQAKRAARRRLANSRAAREWARSLPY